MRPNAPIYIWRKSAGSNWFAQHEAIIAAVAGGNLAVIETAGRRQLQLEACTSRAAGRQLLQNFGGKIAKLPRDWRRRFSSSQSSKPIRIGDRLIVTSEERRHSCRLDRGDKSVAVPSLYIPAGTAFGTGEHATTAMSLRILERLTRTRATGWSLFDAGTGSGIFALAAARFGAGKVIAIDNDPIAISTAKRNARSNQITGVRFAVGDVRKTLRGRFDFVTANLYSDLLLEILPKFRQSLTRDGRLILSGILGAQEPELIRALRANQFQIEETRRRGKWIAFVARQKPS